MYVYLSWLPVTGLNGYKVTPCANVSACASHFCRDHTAAVQIISIRR